MGGFKLFLIIFGAILAASSCGIGGCTVLFASAASDVDDEMTKADEEQAALKSDVTLGEITCDAPDEDGTFYCKLAYEVKNSAKHKRSYAVTADISDADGTRVTEADFAINSLAPGKTSKGTADIYADTKPVKAAIAEVD